MSLMKVYEMVKYASRSHSPQDIACECECAIDALAHNNNVAPESTYSAPVKSSTRVLSWRARSFLFLEQHTKSLKCKLISALFQ